MKYSFLKVGLSLIVISAVMAACYPGGPTYIEDYDVVYTINVDNGVSSDPSKVNFHLADTVMDLSEPGSSPDPIGNQKQLLNTVRKNMLNYGYNEIKDTADIRDSADFVVLVTVVRSDNYVYTWWPGWGGYWPGWGWGGCCWYPPTTTVSNYRTGSVLVQLVDVANVDPDLEIIPVVWQGTIEGLFEGSNTNIENRTERGVNQMFKQSDYLNRN